MTGPRDDRLVEYVARWFAREDAPLVAARSAHRERDLPAIHVSPEEGALLGVLALAVGARRILEVGTLGGYSAVWLARALPADGRLVTLEGSEKHAAVAREAFARAGVEGRVELRIGEAGELLEALEGPFDLIFLDADKAPLPRYFTQADRLLRVGGLLLCDNTFMEGRVADPEASGSDLEGMRAFNAAVADHPRYRAAVAPVRDGLLIAVKLA